MHQKTAPPPQDAGHESEKTMKETVNANIGTLAFTIDRDAYEALDQYFREVRRRLPADDTETMGDLERRTAEILRERVPSPMHVVTIEIVQATIARLGTPADFGEPRTDPASGAAAAEGEGAAAAETSDDGAARRAPARKLYRSRTDRSIAGICGGLGAYFDADPTMIRLVTLLLILFGGVSIWAYIILWIVIPEEPQRTFGLSGNDKKA